MLYILSALTGAILLFGGIFIGRMIAPPPIDPEHLSVSPDDSRVIKARKINRQYFNLMNYTGRPQSGGEESYED